MTRVYLSQRFVDQLRDLPETGQGYQRVDLRFYDGRELEDVVVFNAEECDLPDDYATAAIESVRLALP